MEHAVEDGRPWGRPDPAVAEIRVAVRRALSGAVASSTVGTPLVLVALSGGTDSLALTAAAAVEAPRAGLRCGAVIVDHGLQRGSAEVAAAAAGTAAALGLEPVLVRAVSVDSGLGDGPEAAARAARYAAFAAVLDELGASVLLTAHTRDDQAEQVLLALGRGSGTRALAGIPPVRGRILRPLLGVSRRTTERACAAQDLTPWHDPHNSDPAYARARVRARALPALEHELGPGVAVNLARSAELAREDADALDALADEVFAAHARLEPDGAETGTVELDAAALAAALPALRHRVIRRAAAEGFGVRLSRGHTLAVAALAIDWRGQGPIQLPGLEASRSGSRLRLRRPG